MNAMHRATAEPARSVDHWRYMMFLTGADLEPRDKHVALALAVRADRRTLKTFASRAQLAADTGRTPAAVRAALRVLTDRQLITSAGQRVHRHPPVYLLTVPATPRESP